MWKGGPPDKARRVRVRSLRPGVQMHHPDRIVFRSKPRRRADALLAALMLPELFESPLMRAHLFPLEPSTPNSWKALMAVGFPVRIPPGASGEVVEEFRVVLLRNRSRVVRGTGRRLRLRAQDVGAGAETRVTFVETLELKPGSYTLTLVRTRGDEGEPESASFDLELEPVPKVLLVLLGPILGRRTGDGLLLRGSGSGDSSERHRQSNPGHSPPGGRLVRSLRNSEGDLVGSLVPVSLRLDRGREVRCQPVLDAIATAGAPEGVYRFDARIETRKGGTAARGEVEFTLEAATSRSGSRRP